MKKYRCPCCGEECITPGRRLLPPDRRSVWINISGSRCPRCGGGFRPLPKSRAQILAEAAVVAGLLLPLLYLTCFVNVLFALLAVLLPAFLYPYVVAPLTRLRLPVVRYEREGRRLLIPEPNARLLINETAEKLRHLDIYGIRFEQNTGSARFHETFTDDLIPAVFHQDGARRRGEWGVTLMKKEYIPGELLREGAAFSVVDNGREIAAGKILAVCDPQ